MNGALLLLAVPICIADMSSLVIPNIYMKILSYITLVHLVLFGLGQFQALIASIGILICLLFFGTGMGDIKLIGLIMLTHPKSVIAFVGNILVVATVHIVVLIAIHRRIPRKIPLAPSIFVGLLTYLATR